MIDEIKNFKERVLASPDKEAPGKFYSALADFGDTLNREFRNEFFNLDPVVYWQVPEWKELICFSIQRQTLLEPNQIVVDWVREKIAQFLHNQEIELELG